MSSEKNNFNNDNELKKENENINKPDETVEEHTINYSAVSGSKEYIYGHSEDNEPKVVKVEDRIKEPKMEYTVNEDVKSKPKRRGGRFLSTVALVLVVSLVSGAAGGFVTSYYYRNNSNNNINNVNNANKQNIAINLNNDAYFAAAVNEKAKDTVVGITTTTVQAYNSFWGGRQEQDVQSIGSGVIVDPDGLILTNSHVIGDGQAKNIIVSLIDGTTEQAQVLWYDSALDLAVIKINRAGLSSAELGDSDTLMVGEPVVAIGNPMSLDLNGTLTTGVVSGLNRSITVENVTIKPLIQTDASINPGNSGGPLFNAQGKVIGINTAKMSTAEGLGFSIPINVAIPVLKQISDSGSVDKIYLGIMVANVDEYQNLYNKNFETKYGLVITKIDENGSIYNSELILYDVIVKINEEKIENINDLKRILYKFKNNDKITITYIRDGKEKNTEVILRVKPLDI